MPGDAFAKATTTATPGPPSAATSRGIDRNTLKVFGKIVAPDARARLHQHLRQCRRGSSESPKVEGLIYVGTDDGLIQVTEDGGKTWRKVENFPVVPEMTYVSCVLASIHNADTVYASFNNHKMGDFKPYILRSDDRGRTWKAMTGDLSARDVVHSLAEDHVDSRPALLRHGVWSLLLARRGGEVDEGARPADYQRA